ncbi:MAG: AEC family transporter [Gammaproteobacteria bacterium]|nr:AEC family transporter [Gammaproteobacteria bacterium]
MLENNILPIVLAILPLFLIILVGYSSIRFNILTKESNTALTQYVYYFALPATLFISIAKNSLSNIVYLNFILGFLASMIVLYFLVFAIAYLLKLGNIKQIGILALGISSPNTGFMGIPILAVLIGEQGVIAAAFASVLLTFPMVISIFIIESEKHMHHGLLKRTYKSTLPLLKNPIVISALIGISFSVLGISIPHFFETTIEQLSNTTAPCALFAIGQTLYGNKIVNNNKIRSFLFCLGKLIIHPIIMLFFVYIFNIPSPFGIAALILSAIPTAALTFILAKKYNIYENETSDLIFKTTAYSALTIPIITTIATKILA